MTSKLGGGKMLRSQAREIIFNVLKFMRKEAQEGIKIPLKSVLLFKSGIKTGDYHGDMNHENYLKWLRNQLIPNLPPNSLVVLDNAPYHNVQHDRCPSSSAKKDIMKAWLDTGGVVYEQSDTKIELYAKIKRRKEPVIYEVDRLLAEHGHSTLRLPPYHPELNPIENIWGVMKNWVAANNVTFKLDNVKRLVEEKCENISSGVWKKACDRAKEVENNYINVELMTDNLEGEFIIALSSESDSSETDTKDEGE
jgi:transposase